MSSYTPHMSALDPVGPQADSIAGLWNVFLAVAVIVWVSVVAFAAIATFRAIRANRAKVDLGIVDTSRDRRIAAAIIAAGVVTLLTLVGLLVASVLTSRSLASLEAGPNTVYLQVEGHRWWWGLTYYPKDPQRTAVTANEIHIPVGVPVQLALTSSDVIHSFWVPSLHGKRDLVPGRTNVTMLRVDRPGTYRGMCAEFCGLQHAQMTITVVAEPLAQFEAWLARQREPAVVPDDAEAQRGKRVFETGPCVACHTITGTRAGSRFGPDLTHFGSRSTIAATTIANTRASLEAWLVDPHGIKPGVLMPATALTREDLRALATYLESLR